MGLRAWVKLSGQIAVAASAWALDINVGSMFGTDLPAWADLLITVFWFVALMNAFNLIDGMDGVAAGLGSIASAALIGSFLLRGRPSDCLVTLGLLGACLGFLHYNFHPARVFLGDTGSMFIGFALAAISLSTYTKGTAFTALAVPALVVGVPLFDTFLAVWRRTARKFSAGGEKHTGAAGATVFGADKDHLHHRLHAGGRSQKKVAFMLYLAAVGLAAVGLLAQVFYNLASGIYLIAFVAAVFVIVRHVAHVELWDSASALVHGLSRPLRREIVVPAYIVGDLLILLGSQFLSHLMLRDSLGVTELRQGIFQDIAFQVAIPFVALATAGMYRRIWSRARLMDFLYLAAALCGGLAVGFALAIMLQTEFTKLRLLETTIQGAFALTLMSAVRLFRRIAADVRGSVMARGLGAATSELQRALIYGAGHTGLLFLHAEGDSAPGSGRGYRVIGFLDDDTNIHGRLMHGYPVIGGRENLATLLPSTAADLVIITARLDAETLRHLLGAAGACGVRVLKWQTSLEDISEPWPGAPYSGRTIQRLQT
jgi:UDP-N-acetylmuramyl pentapeptide phosphotransferase/UDP-N-acetylglucosamine-1-phosphate transferase